MDVVVEFLEVSFSLASDKFIKILLLPKETFPHTFDPKSHFRWFGVPQTELCPLNRGNVARVSVSQRLCNFIKCCSVKEVYLVLNITVSSVKR